MSVDKPLTFVDLFFALGDTTSSTEKIKLLRLYFDNAVEDDSLWGIFLLCGGKAKRPLSSKQLRSLVGEVTNLPTWLIEESYHIVGDLAETVALLVARKNLPENRPKPVLNDWMEALSRLQTSSQEASATWLKEQWATLSHQEILVLNKLMTGGLRIGVGKGLVIKSLAQTVELDEGVVAHLLAGRKSPRDFSITKLREDSIKSGSGKSQDSLNPYPFCLAYPLDQEVSTLGDISEWAIEWKWDGIRAQIVKRGDKSVIWSRGEEIVNESFPELLDFADALPNGTVLDGEIVALSNGSPASFNTLQKRLNRRVVSIKLLHEIPVQIILYDLIELDGVDLRALAYSERRAKLSNLIATTSSCSKITTVSQPLLTSSWSAASEFRLDARKYFTEGLMLKRLSSPYLVGRKRGDWWKWKLDPLTCDGVLIYAQKGHGRRADLFTDYTFAVWDGDRLVPFAKAYSGLTDKELKEVDNFIKKNTVEKFGPVRTVTPTLVFEIAFEGIGASSRHKSGVSVRFPRILRWRRDKPALEADTLESLKALIE